MELNNCKRNRNFISKGLIALTIFLILESLAITLAFGLQKRVKKNEFYPGDALQITFIDIYKQQNRKSIDINGEYTIDSRGYVIMPLISPLKVTGYNRYTLAEKIIEATGMTAKIALPVLLLLEGSNGITVNIFPEGRLLLRKFPNQHSAEEFVRQLSSVVF